MWMRQKKIYRKIQAWYSQWMKVMRTQITQSLTLWTFAWTGCSITARSSAMTMANWTGTELKVCVFSTIFSTLTLFSILSAGVYQDTIKIFEKILLPTYNTHHVQFVMFLLCSFKLRIAEAFLNYLWKKVCTPRFAAVHRQSAVAYIASLLARGSFISLK